MPTVANCCKILQAPKLTKGKYNIETPMLIMIMVAVLIVTMLITTMTTLAQVMRQPLQSAKKVCNNTAIVSKRIRNHVAY